MSDKSLEQRKIKCEGFRAYNNTDSDYICKMMRQMLDEVRTYNERTRF